MRVAPALGKKGGGGSYVVKSEVIKDRELYRVITRASERGGGENPN